MYIYIYIYIVGGGFSIWVVVAVQKSTEPQVGTVAKKSCASPRMAFWEFAGVRLMDSVVVTQML